jgi:hypothetical protein
MAGKPEARRARRGQNPFDQASRYTAKLNPPALLRWLLPRLPRSFRFLLWLDAHNVPFPGERRRICDTVACLEDGAHPGPLWALPIEFQSKPDPDMFGRLLEYLGGLHRTLRLTDRPGERYQVGAILLNLTGAGEASRDFALPGTGVRTCLGVEEKNLAGMSAADALADIAAGRVDRCVLPWIPLLKGGGKGTMALWKRLAAAEPNERLRADYGGLALVFAELAGHRPVWRKALEGWSVEQSQQVLDWQKIAEKRGEKRGQLTAVRNMLRRLLQKRFGPLPKALATQIDATTDLHRLQAAVEQVLDLKSLDDLHL